MGVCFSGVDRFRMCFRRKNRIREDTVNADNEHVGGVLWGLELLSVK